MDRSTDKTKVPIDTKQTHLRVAVHVVRMQPPLEYDEYLGMLRGRKACSQSQSVRPVPQVRQSISRSASQRAPGVSQLVGGRCDDTDFTCHPFPCRTYYTTYSVLCSNAMACMSNGCHLRNPHNRVRQGPRQARRGRRRLIQPVQLAEASDHLWSYILHRTSYRPTDVGYLVPFFF